MPVTRPIRSILIANRGEIACRIIRTCRRLGIRSVVVFSEPDRNSLFCVLADEAIALPGSEARDTYLQASLVIEAARRANVDAIHPGYGFLSESALFARLVSEAGFIFIGPSPDAMEALGNKVRAKALAQSLGVSCLESFTIDPAAVQSEDLARACADFAVRNPFPLLFKAASGGGGRGMRIVHTPSELAEQARAAAREALAFFGDDTIYLERYISPARHVEVQLVGDHHGTVLTLGERECSLQRKHQKVIEEAPARISDATRNAIHAQSRLLAGAVSYANLGTAEFLLSESEEIFFCEVNSRLQVEHPVTEAELDRDLVELQIRVASGESLSEIGIGDPVTRTGYAIEARICAELPDQDFRPSTGRITHLDLNRSENLIRIDTGFRSGDVISHYYDSLLAKMIVHDSTRAGALQKLRTALETSEVSGIGTNIRFLLALLAQPSVEEQHYSLSTPAEALDSFIAGRCFEQGLGAALTVLHQILSEGPLRGWRQSGQARGGGGIRCDDITFDLEWSIERDLFSCRASHRAAPERSFSFRISAVPGAGTRIDFHESNSGRSGTFDLRRLSKESFSASGSLGPLTLTFSPPPRTVDQDVATRSGTAVFSSLPGKIVSVLVNPGDGVEAGDVLIVLESMKMEHPITSPRHARISEIHVVPGDTVQARQPLIDLV